METVLGLHPSGGLLPSNLAPDEVSSLSRTSAYASAVAKEWITEPLTRSPRSSTRSFPGSPCFPRPAPDAGE